MRRARRVEAELTEEVGRRWGRAEARRGGAQQRPRRREGRRWLRLASGAAGEDVGGEGGSKMEIGDGPGGSHCGGGGGTATKAAENASGAATILASEANEPSQGWTGEAAMCSGVGEEAEQRGERDGGRCF
jgi:hypothetical protein